MDKRFKTELSNFNHPSSIHKFITMIFKLWFVWAVVWLAGVITLGCVAWHFVAKFW